MRASQSLCVPALILSIGAAQAAKVPDGYHKVKAGETASKIARTNKLSLSALAALNPQIKLTKLAPGMQLRVKGAARPASTAETEAVEATQTEAPEARKTLLPVEPLPAIPAQGPSTLIHLERVLPNTLRKTVPPSAPDTTSSFRPIQTTAAPLPRLQPVFLPSTGLEYESVLASSLGFEPADPSNLDLLWPVETRTVSSAWGPRIRTRTVRIVKAATKKRVRVRYHSSHKGVDLTAPTGTDVYAAMDGRVIQVGKHRQYGNFVTLDHGNGIVTLYSHHKVNFARLGEIVQRGQKIGEVGRTGNATGPHLHFELRVQGQHHNPLPFLNDVEEIPSELMAFNNATQSNSKR
jgi:murein DD-endopeptidase MepM/ murein hydrolase activator NlpD